MFGIVVVFLFVAVHSERFADLVVFEQFANGGEDAAEPQQSDHDPHANHQPVPRSIAGRTVLACTTDHATCNMCSNRPPLCREYAVISLIEFILPTRRNSRQFHHRRRRRCGF